jgi:hypothetical protein
MVRGLDGDEVVFEREPSQSEAAREEELSTISPRSHADIALFNPAARPVDDRAMVKLLQQSAIERALKQNHLMQRQTHHNPGVVRRP